MISTKWVQGTGLENVFSIRNIVYAAELNFSRNYIHDDYDSFAKNVLVFDSEKPVGTGRLYFKDGEYIIDKVCVIKEFRNNNYGDLIIRMLVRKAASIGAEKVYSYVNNEYINLFKRIGFAVENEENGVAKMAKIGDVCGNCCH